ncbi:hypothetical protein CLAM6_02440 [Cobetia sp. AM6]|nr:hypothetical protein CLAM6_02440 [Cobetia sp. AM6]
MPSLSAFFERVMGDTFEGEIVMSDSQVGGCGWREMGDRAAASGVTHPAGAA